MRIVVSGVAAVVVVAVVVVVVAVVMSIVVFAQKKSMRMVLAGWLTLREQEIPKQKLVHVDPRRISYI